VGGGWGGRKGFKGQQEVRRGMGNGSKIGVGDLPHVLFFSLHCGNIYNKTQKRTNTVLINPLKPKQIRRREKRRKMERGRVIILFEFFFFEENPEEGSWLVLGEVTNQNWAELTREKGKEREKEREFLNKTQKERGRKGRGSRRKRERSRKNRQNNEGKETIWNSIVNLGAILKESLKDSRKNLESNGYFYLFKLLLWLLFVNVLVPAG